MHTSIYVFIMYSIASQDPLRAVVMADRLILIVPDGADSLLSILDKYMNEWVGICDFINISICGCTLYNQISWHALLILS